jgi:2,4-dienoyl-CoA reductase-like NADH-dependent reductase (Old Yellow Enzyme family)
MDAGVDYLQISNGIGPEAIDYPEGLPYSRTVWMGVQMHEHVDGRVPVSVVNGILEPNLAHLLINEGLADTIDAARALLADPRWALGVLEGADYVRCRNCQICFWSPFMPHRCPAVAERRRGNPDCVDYSDE